MAETLPSNLTVKEMEESGAPVSGLRSWYNRVKDASGGSGAMARAKMHAAAAGQAVRQGGEAILVGAALGAAHVQLSTGLDVRKVPVDAVVGALGLLGGAAFAHEEFGVDLRNSGAAAATVFAFRKTYAFMAAKKTAAGGKPGGTFSGDDEGFVHGDMGAEDPVIAAARFL